MLRENALQRSERRNKKREEQNCSQVGLSSETPPGLVGCTMPRSQSPAGNISHPSSLSLCRLVPPLFLPLCSVSVSFYFLFFFFCSVPFPVSTVPNVQNSMKKKSPFVKVSFFLPSFLCVAGSSLDIGRRCRLFRCCCCCFCCCYCCRSPWTRFNAHSESRSRDLYRTQGAPKRKVVALFLLSSSSSPSSSSPSSSSSLLLHSRVRFVFRSFAFQRPCSANVEIGLHSLPKTRWRVSFCRNKKDRERISISSLMWRVFFFFISVLFDASFPTSERHRQFFHETKWLARWWQKSGG